MDQKIILITSLEKKAKLPRFVSTKCRSGKIDLVGMPRMKKDVYVTPSPLKIHKFATGVDIPHRATVKRLEHSSALHCG